MNGIPKYINTKNDVINLQAMAIEKLINVYEWKMFLKGLQQPTIFRIPVISKDVSWFKIPYTERELPNKYEIIEVVRNDKNIDEIEEYIKIKGAIEDDFIELNGGYQEAERLGLTQEEIARMIFDLK